MSLRLIGRTLGSYRIVKSLGEGGMAAVFLGQHTEIGSRVAIKILLPELSAQSEIIRRFLDEARAANRIAHPGIIRIHDCGSDPDVGAYLVMEHLEGETLAERYSRRGVLPLAMVTRILKQTALAVAAAHDAGIIHRDLKPSNLFLVAEPDLPGGERVKVLDFGIAKLTEGGVGEMTVTGSKMGTPSFMAPEQCIDSKRVDARSDIYALGVIGYLMLSGRYPVPGDGALQIYTKQVDLPTSLLEWGISIPASLDQLLLKALHPRREERFESMEQLHQALCDPAFEVESEPGPPAGEDRRRPASAPAPAPPAAPGCETISLRGSPPAAEEASAPQQTRLGYLLKTSIEGRDATSSGEATVLDQTTAPPPAGPMEQTVTDDGAHRPGMAAGEETIGDDSTRLGAPDTQMEQTVADDGTISAGAPASERGAQDMAPRRDRILVGEDRVIVSSPASDPDEAPLAARSQADPHTASIAAAHGNHRLIYVVAAVVIVVVVVLLLTLR